MAKKQPSNTRTGAPSNGKYAKKTKPSAKNGLQMYYQNGLDFKPKSMQEGGETAGHTSQAYENPIIYTRDQFKKGLIPKEETYVLGHFERNPNALKVTSATTIDEVGSKWPGQVVDVHEYSGNKSKGLNPVGNLAIYDPTGQLPATEKPIIKGKSTLIENYQNGGNKADSVSNEVMRRQLYRESRFNPEAFNKTTKASGLAQLRPIAVEELKTKHKLAVNPIKPKQAIKAHKKLMTVNYNKPWIDKEDSTEEVRTAKTLAAYNWGPTSLANLLNKQKAKGVDIYKSVDWIKALPKETQDYITDITGQNPEFEKEYQGAINSFKYKGAYPVKKQMGGPIEDNMGQWAHPGKVTKINSNKITMKGVDYPVLGISDTGHQQMMQPNQDYAFDGTTVTEYPMGQQDKGQLKKLDELTRMAKSGIHIKPENKGKFTATKKATGKTTEQLTHSKNPLTRKRAIFAQNAKKWHHAFNGALEPFTANQYNPQIATDSATSMNQALQGINPSTPNTFEKIGGVGGALDLGTGLLQGAGMLQQEKQNKQSAHQFAALSDVVKQAATGPVDKPKRKYVRPEDQIFDPNQMSPTYGTGSNFLQMQKGGTLPIKAETKEELYKYYNSAVGHHPISPIYAEDDGRMSRNILIDRFNYFNELNNIGPQTNVPPPGISAKVFDAMNAVRDKERTKYKKGGEIQNTYAPNTIYDDLGYEPLSESEIIKAQFGAQAGSLGSALTSKIFGGTGEQSGAGKIGSTLGSTVGSLFGPVGNAVGGFIGGAIGGAIGAKGQKQTANWQKEGYNNLAQAANQQNIHNQYAAFMRSGGHLKEDYVEPSEEALTPYAMGGQLKTHWGGKAEPVSYNPYLPDGGESIEFKGQSHDDGGIGVTFGKSPVEVEGGEPAVKLQSGGETDNLVVFGDMKIPSYGVSEIGDEKAKGKKFKTYIKDLNKTEARQNSIIKKGNSLAEEADENDPFEILKINSGKAMITGGDMKLKDIAKKKQMASIVQNAILETADEHGLKSDELAKGKFKKAKNGGKFTSAQYGIGQGPGFGNAPKPKRPWYLPEDNSLVKGDMSGILYPKEETQDYIDKLRYTPKEMPQPTYAPFEDTGSFTAEGYRPIKENQTRFEVNPYENRSGNDYGHLWYNGDYSINEGAIKPAEKAKEKVKTIGKNPRKATKQESIDKLLTPTMAPENTPYSPITMDMVGPGNPVELTDLPKKGQVAQQTGKGKKGDGLGLLDYLNAYAPYLRPSNKQKLDPNQLMGEMYALSQNQLEPVQAQRYNPLLEQATDYSFQDQLNANQADFNAISKQVGNNPAALAALAAQKYGANSGVLANQFRTNQEQKLGVYNRNRGVLNDATLKNLGIMDQQYQRQASAKSNTKAVAQAALSSISDKIAKNKLENKTLGIYENLYNYRFGPQGRAWNMNAPAQFNTDANFQQLDENGNIISTVENQVKRDALGRIKEYRDTKRTTSKGKSKNGSIVKATKGR